MNMTDYIRISIKEITLVLKCKMFWDKLVIIMNGKKIKEIVLYLIFGVLTTVVNVASFYIFNKTMEIHYLPANAVAWFLSVVFAYFTNRTWVFESKDSNILSEFAKFVSCRLFSGGCDMVIMFVGIDILHSSSVFTKLLTNVVVVVLNYVFSKWIIFREKRVDR